MAAEILREFLVKLGYQVDAGSQRNMMDNIGAITVKTAVMAAEVEAAAASVVYAVHKIASQFEQLYYMSRRTADGVENINAFGYAITQMGGSIEGARSSLENLARFLRSSPGAASMLRGIGVDVVDATGKLRGMSQIMVDLATRLRQMPYYRAQAYASILGIDERTLQAMMNDVGNFSAEYHRMAQKIGLDSDQAAEHFRFFEQRFRALSEVVKLIGTRIAADLAGPLGQQMEQLRQLILENSDDIVMALEAIARAIIWIGSVIVRLSIRAVQAFKDIREYWKSLPEDFRKGVETILLVAAAFAFLNSTISASPIGILLRLTGLLLLLYDDYKTWKETGGKGALIDWDKWGPGIEAAWGGIEHIGRAIDSVVQSIGGWKTVAEAFFAYMTATWVIGIVRACTTAITSLQAAAASSVTSVTATASGLARALGLLLRFGGPIGAFVLGMWPTETAGPAQDETGYGKVTPGNYNMMRGYGPEPPTYNRWNPNTWSQAGRTNAEQLIDFWTKNFGLSVNQAAGLAAQFKAESAYDPTRVGDNGRAYGLGQWHPDRQATFQQVMGKPIQQSTWEDQARFYIWELQHTERQAGLRVFTAQTPEEAALGGTQAERPADFQGESARRALEARRLADAYRESHPAASAQITQNNNITINGARDPAVTGDEVNRALTRLHADLLRNSRSVMQ